MSELRGTSSLPVKEGLLCTSLRRWDIPFVNGDLMAFTAESQGRAEPAYPGAYNSDIFFVHDDSISEISEFVINLKEEVCGCG